MTELQAQSQAQMQQETPIQLTLTLGEINSMIQALHKAPYELSKPLIDKVTEQAQAYVSRTSARPSTPQPVPQMAVPIPLRSPTDQ